MAVGYELEDLALADGELWGRRHLDRGVCRERLDHRPLQPLPGTERSRFPNVPIQSLTYRGGIYGVPWGMDAGMLYCRKDLLEQSGFSGPRKTWEELKEMTGK